MNRKLVNIDLAILHNDIIAGMSFPLSGKRKYRSVGYREIFSEKCFAITFR